MEENIKTDEKGRKFIASETGVKVFVDFRDNLIVDPDDPVVAAQARNFRFGEGPARGLSRLGSENSEDALTWNVFRTLEKTGPEGWFPEIFTGIALDEDERFMASALRFWDTCFPPMTRPFPEGETHVDLTLETSKKLIFIEAKYKSEISKNTKHDPGRDQIVRNIDVGTWAAKKRAKAFYFVLLTLKTNTYSIDRFHYYKSSPENIADKIGSYRKDIRDYAALCDNIHVMYWDQILRSLSNLAPETGRDHANLIDYLNAKLF